MPSIHTYCIRLPSASGAQLEFSLPRPAFSGRFTGEPHPLPRVLMAGRVLPWVAVGQWVFPPCPDVLSATWHLLMPVIGLRAVDKRKGKEEGMEWGWGWMMPLNKVEGL